MDPKFNQHLEKASSVEKPHITEVYSQRYCVEERDACQVISQLIIFNTCQRHEMGCYLSIPNIKTHRCHTEHTGDATPISVHVLQWSVQ